MKSCEAYGEIRTGGLDVITKKSCEAYSEIGQDCYEVIGQTRKVYTYVYFSTK